MEEFEWLQEELTIDQECIFNHDALVRLIICKGIWSKYRNVNTLRDIENTLVGERHGY